LSTGSENNKRGRKINIAVEKLLTRAASGKKINQG